MTTAQTRSFDWYEELLLGAHVVEVERHGNSHLRLHFEHRGTSDYASVLVVSLDGVHPGEESYCGD